MSTRWDSRNKRWRFEFDRVIEGRRQRTSRLLPQGWTQAQADAFDRKEGARLYAIATGIERPDPLISQAVLLYLQDKRHLKSYTKAEENLAAIAWAYQGRTLSELADVANTVSAHRQAVREGKTLSPATIKQRLALLKAACRWAWKKHEICDADPTTRMQLPTVRNERHVYATRLQMLQLARAADRHDVRVLIRVAFYSGMRLSEVQRAQLRGDAFFLADTKNDTARSVPIHPKLRTCLKHLPLTAPTSTLERAWQRARERCGLQHIHLHDLRHSAASEMINADIDLYTVGQVLGHKDPRSTKRYAHLTHNKLAAAVATIGRRVEKTPAQPPAQKRQRPPRKVA